MNRKQFLIFFKILVCTALISTASITLAQAQEAFKTPTGNIGCAVYDGVLRCDLMKNDAKIPPKPASCTEDWGSAFSMSATGKPIRLCHGDTVFAEEEPTLDYGRSWDHQGFHCSSEKTGLTCINQSHRGWMLKRSEQQLF